MFQLMFQLYDAVFVRDPMGGFGIIRIGLARGVNVFVR